MRNPRRAVTMLAIGALVSAGDLAAQSNRSPGRVASAGFGVFGARRPGPRYPVYTLAVGGELPLPSPVMLRGTVTRTKGVYVEPDFTCVDPCNDPDPEYPATIWSVDADLVAHVLPAALVSLVAGASAGTPHGRIGRPNRSSPGGVSALWHLGIEFGRVGQSGVSVQLAHTWLPNGFLDASRVSSLALQWRFD